MSKKDKSVVAMLDLLGFSQIMEEQSLDEIERRYTQNLMSALSMAGFSSIGAFVFDDNGDLDYGEDLWTVSFGAFSDTVVIYPRRFVNQPLRTTCEVVALLIDVALQSDWLFRGGIDFGSFRALSDHNLFIGKALIGAYRLEGMQNWSGAIISDNAHEKYQMEVEKMLEQRLLVKYQVPIKTTAGIIDEEKIAINWCYFDMRWQLERRDKLQGLLCKAPEAAKEKIEATILFHDEMKMQGFSSLKQIGGGEVIGDPSAGMA